ncbi:DUF3592 domain-containing protein [Cryptosporangium arvum]|uniref:DUF3592 domain-containing protein n=1 Tax=Cryptosporangium arvum TaxID=80871 RepID=UPI0004AF420D|nr:DUF3592 domain-containing protein [Cryptosporangium arvum]
MGVVVVLVIVLFIALFGGLTVRDLARMRGWPATSATVVDNVYDPHRGENGGGMYQSIVEFRTADGRVVRSSDRSWSGRPSYRTGAEVTVRYDLSNPERVVVGRKNTLICGAITLVLIVFLALAATR